MPRYLWHLRGHHFAWNHVTAFLTAVMVESSAAIAWREAGLPRLGTWSPSRAAPLSLEEAAGGGMPKSYAVVQLRQIPHLNKPFTQGLEFTPDGWLVETSGDYPPGVGSYVRIVDPATGATARKVTEGMHGPMFLEGITRLNDRWYASTYLNKVVLEFDERFNFVGSHTFPYEGWGLTRSQNGESFLATNGSEYFLSLEAGSFRLLSEKLVTCFGKAVQGLNELEFIEDFLGAGPAVLGNIIDTRLVLVLNPDTAICTAAFHLKDLEPEQAAEVGGFHVANGIAYNKQNGTLWVTGKNWESMFEIRLIEEHAPQQEALHLLRSYLGSRRS